MFEGLFMTVLILAAPFAITIMKCRIIRNDR